MLCINESVFVKERNNLTLDPVPERRREVRERGAGHIVDLPVRVHLRPGTLQTQ